MVGVISVHPGIFFLALVLTLVILAWSVVCAGLTLTLWWEHKKWGAMTNLFFFLITTAFLQLTIKDIWPAAFPVI